MAKRQNSDAQGELDAAGDGQGDASGADARSDASGQGADGAAGNSQQGGQQPQLRTDGPTLEEWLKAGYKEEHYPPKGYTDKRVTQAPEAQLVKMRRVEPMRPGGPVSAEVHASEVENWIAAGWRREE